MIHDALSTKHVASELKMDSCPQCGFNPQTDSLDDIYFVYADRMVYRNGVGVRLTTIEMDLFEIFYDLHGKGMILVDILDALYGHRAEEDMPKFGSNIVSVHMSKMRPKLAKIGLAIGSDGAGRQPGIYQMVNTSSKFDAIRRKRARRGKPVRCDASAGARSP